MKRTQKPKMQKLSNFKKEELKKAQTIKGGDDDRGVTVIVVDGVNFV